MDSAGLLNELAEIRTKQAAIALDFDGVCKLFTHHKHQIMRTCLFLHLYEFQRAPFPVFLEAYEYINFRSAVAGKERFLCAESLATHLKGQGYDVDLPGLHNAVGCLKEKGLRISADNLERYSEADDVRRALAWSNEINEKVAMLSEIGLTPGIREHVFDPFIGTSDFYVVTTAAGETLPPLMEKEGVDFILKYIGQETAPKAEALESLGGAGYSSLFMFGDSVEDSRASEAASRHMHCETVFMFIPVIPGEEEDSFRAGRNIMSLVLKNRIEEAAALCRIRQERFSGNEVTA